LFSVGFFSNGQTNNQQQRRYEKKNVAVPVPVSSVNQLIKMPIKKAMIAIGILLLISAFVI
jgi:hypothetical protein